MPDEPSGELPQPPLKSLFQRWAEERVENPRDIAAEVREEMSGAEISPKSESREDIVKRLAFGFDEQIKKILKEDNNLSDEEIQIFAAHDKGLVADVFGNGMEVCLEHDFFEFDSVAGEYTNKRFSPEEENICLTIYSRRENFDQTRRIATTKGAMPTFFLGSDGNKYFAYEIFKLNPNTGYASKTSRIQRGYGGDSLGDIEKVNYKLPENARNEEFNMELTPEDFEKLGDILGKMKKGEIGNKQPDNG